jgi:tetratricopeptide (TPR) repeat protein
MKKISLFLITALLAMGLQAQLTTPQPSPASTLKQQVGLSEVTVEYSRPSMRGRTIFGDLVPYDQLWRTGANMNTTISFSDDVTIGDQALKAGTYAIFTKPGATSWEVYFYTDTNNGGTPESWDESKVAARVTAEVYTMPVDIETFTISIDDLHNNGGTLGMLWEKSYVGVKFGVPTVEKAVKSIETVMNGPSANDYYAAAAYYHEEGKDLKQAKEWIDKAVSMNADAFWILRRQSLIYAKMGDKDGAIKAAKKSMAAAEAANNSDYVKLNKDSLKEWGAL